MPLPLSLPRLRLQTLFLLFFCAAVGFSTYPHPLAALGPAIETAMVIGMIQQTLQLVAWRPKDELSCDLRFARRFAVGWRILLATTFGGAVLVQMLLAKRIFEYPERDDLVSFEPFANPLLPLCGIVVLCNSLAQWRSSTRPVRQSTLNVVLFGAFATTITLIALVNSGITESLVHRALDDMEASIPDRFQRPGVYPDLADEGYLTLWLAFGAFGCLAAAALLGAALARRRLSRGKRIATIAFWALLSVPAAFSYWYYASEFYRLSPELAGAGMAHIWLDWIIHGAIAPILVTAGAYKLGQTNETTTAPNEISANLGGELERHSLHESVWCLAPLFGSMVYQVSMGVIDLSGVALAFGKASLHWFLSCICHPLWLLLLAAAIATIQISWIRWKNRSKSVPWQLGGLSRAAFVQSWLTLALLLLVAVPTIHAFSFIIWLGPVDLLPLLGY